ncbi:unnamed protein product [Brassica oleracea var. botrytis]|uniref:11S globulin n=1 Tax=Brassica napus TaxID=3708 RepID=A0A816KB37_BRANA|nr:unnamed protein product [Brassica napus]
MARFSSLLYFSITVLIFLHGSTAQQFPNECQLDQLNALEPSHVLKAEAGRIEVWDHHAPQLRCSGVSFVRYIIESQGLYLPSFLNTAKLSFVANGQGLMGRVVRGCAETFQDSSVFQPGSGSPFGEGQGQGQGQQGQSQGQHGQGQGFRDMHQKVEHIRSGDTIATHPGVAQWFYNNRNQTLVIVAVMDLASHQNQLDRNPRTGKPKYRWLTTTVTECSMDKSLKGQLLSIPQGFSVVKRATSDQFRWIEFKTNANAQINTLAGRTSVMRGLPLEVIANGYQISLEEARRVKFNTIETTLTHSSGPASYGRPRKADA